MSGAKEALTTKLEGLELDTNADGDIDVQAGNATPANVEAAATAAAGNVDTELGVVGFATAGENTKQGLISDGRAEDQKAITSAQEALTKAENAAGSAVVSAVEAVESRAVAYGQAIDAANVAANAEDAELAKFATLNAEIATTANVSVVPAATAADSDELTINGTSVAELNNGKWTTLTTTAAQDELKALEGFDTYLAALQAETDANTVETNAQKALDEAIIAAVEADTDNTSLDSVPAGAYSTSTVDGKTTVTINSLEAVDNNTVAAPTAPTVVETTAGTATTPEVQTITFTDLIEGQSVTIDGITITAPQGGLTAAAVSDAFIAGTADSGNFAETIGQDAQATFTFTADGDVALLTPTVGGGTVATTVTATDANDILAKSIALETAEKNLQDLNDAISKWEAAVQLDTEVKGLQNDVTEAQAAIEDSVEDGGLGIKLLQDSDSFTNANDVYLFNEVDSAGESLSGFGVNGEDKIFFGEGFSLVEITGDKGINGNQGDVNALEVFWAQDGNNLNLFVENETFAGNGSGTADLTQITLTGVSAEDVTFEGGFLSAGTAA